MIVNDFQFYFHQMKLRLYDKVQRSPFSYNFTTFLYKGGGQNHLAYIVFC